MEVRACRICLATGVGLRSLRQEPLKTAIALVINNHNDPTSFPSYACYKCAQLLLRCAKFIELTRNTTSILFRIYIEQGEVTETAIESIEREQLNVTSNLTHCLLNPDDIISFQHEDDDLKDDLPLASILRVEVSEIKSEDDFMEMEDPEIKEEAETEHNNGDILVDVPKKHRKKKHKNDEESPFPKTKTKKSKSKPTAKRKSKKKGPEKERSKLIEKVELESSKTTRKTRALDAKLSKYFTIVMLSYEEQVSEVERRKLDPAFSRAPHCCPHCHKTYQRVDSFNNHMAEHDPQRGALECAVCRKRFSSRRTLARHLHLAHEKLYRCSRCPHACRARQALSHMNRHEGVKETLKCSQCDFVTDARAQHVRHVSAVHGRRHACAACGKSFATERGLATHHKRGHAPAQGDQSYRCAQCALSFRTEGAWRAHMTTDERHKKLDGKSNVCKKCFASFATLEELTSHNSDTHAGDNVFPKNCTICGAVVGSNKQHWLHVVHAHPALKASYRSRAQTELCETCGKGCKSVTDLRLHALRHSGARSVQCAVCARAFYDHYQLRMHTRTVHSDARPHQCPVCQRLFKVKGNCTRHMLVHTGERPHACSVCGKGFTQAASRDLHHRTVHLRLPHPPRKRKRADRAQRIDTPAVELNETAQ